MKTYTQLVFSCSPEFAEEFVKEAERLKITRIELLRRMINLWLEVTRKKTGA